LFNHEPRNLTNEGPPPAALRRQSLRIGAAPDGRSSQGAPGLSSTITRGIGLLFSHIASRLVNAIRPGWILSTITRRRARKLRAHVQTRGVETISPASRHIYLRPRAVARRPGPGTTCARRGGNFRPGGGSLAQKGSPMMTNLIHQPGGGHGQGLNSITRARWTVAATCDQLSIEVGSPGRFFSGRPQQQRPGPSFRFAPTHTVGRPFCSWTGPLADQLWTAVQAGYFDRRFRRGKQPSNGDPPRVPLP